MHLLLVWKNELLLSTPRAPRAPCATAFAGGPNAPELTR
jgi:hypothetical protein